MALHRMRTIPETLAAIRELDKESAVTPYCIRTLCKNGQVRCVFTGRKILVDLDDMFRYLGYEEQEAI